MFNHAIRKTETFKSSGVSYSSNVDNTGRLVITADFPGVDPARLAIDVVSGPRHLNISNGEKVVQSFKISDQFDLTAVSASHAHGRLTIVLQRLKSGTSTKVPISIG